MSETVQAVAITGLVSLLATYVGPFFAARATRKQEAITRRRQTASELRPLAVSVLVLSRRVIALSEKEFAAIKAGPSVLERFDALNVDGRDALREARADAKTALTELELSSDDPAVTQALVSQRLSLEVLDLSLGSSRQDLRADGEGSTVFNNIPEVIDTAKEHIHRVSSALQKLTALDPSTRKPEADAQKLLDETRALLLTAEKVRL